jgi:hypothetical protein
MATYIHGKGSNFQMDNAAGTLVDLSAMVSDAKISLKVDTADTSHFGSNSKTYIVGQNDGTSSVTGLFDRTMVGTITAAFNALLTGTPASLTVQLGPEGILTGSTKISQEMIITSLEIGASVGDLVSASFDLQRTGDTTFGVF